MAFDYTPYTSENLDVGNALMTNISEYTGIGAIPSLPNGKQVIFFSLGLVCVIASIALISRSLISDNIPALASIAKLVA